MIRELTLCCALAGLPPTVSAESLPAPEAWMPTSHTAQAVTGRVMLTATVLTFQNGSSLTLGRVDGIPAMRF